MGMEEATGFCRQCNANRLISRKATSHVFHFVMTLLTFGLWLIVWGLASIRFGGWRCSVCGAKVERRLFT